MKHILSNGGFLIDNNDGTFDFLFEDQEKSIVLGLLEEHKNLTNKTIAGFTNWTLTSNIHETFAFRNENITFGYDNGFILFHNDLKKGVHEISFAKGTSVPAIELIALINSK